MDKIKILFPIGSFYPSRQSGPGNAVYRFINKLPDEFSCIVVTSTFETNELDVVNLQSQLRENLRIFYLKGLFVDFQIFLRSAVFLFRADILHLTGLYYPGSFFLCCLGLLAGKRVVWSVRGNLDEYSLRSRSGKTKSIFVRILNLPFFKKVFFHTTSNSESIQVRKYLGSSTRIVEVPNSYDCDSDSDSDSADLIYKFNYVLFIGRIHPVKGIENLLTAYSNSSNFMNSDMKLLIAGRGSEEYVNKLKKNFKHLLNIEKVIFIGTINGLKKEIILKNAYFTIVPSFSENFCNVILESISYGTPVIASTGTPWQLLQSKKAGFWVSNEIESLKTNFNNILELSNLDYINFRINAKLFSNEFKTDSICPKWVNFYNELLIHG